MFIQVITGKVTDAVGFKRASDRWDTELRPGAKGYLGGTFGVTDDGRFVVFARFESEAAAQANNERPEQGAWWAEMERCVESVSFRNSAEVVTLLGGGSDDAGFVQVMLGHVTDPTGLDTVRKRTAEFESVMSKFRPDVLGEVIAVHADGTYSDAVYFSSEAAAREGETTSQEPPADVKAMLDDLMGAIAVDEYLDLREPWFN
jgi:hypothetical protein